MTQHTSTTSTDANNNSLNTSEQVIIRPATANDVQKIFDNIGYWASQGKMLVRPMPQIFEDLREYLVAEVETEDGLVFAGNVALHILWGDIAEVRGLAVQNDVRAKGIGKKLVLACEEEARALGIPQLFAWTYEIGFFENCGYTLIDKSKDLHSRVWSECLRCPFFVGCNENGMLKRLEGVAMPENLPEPPPAQIPPNVI